ncbi:MAG: hypothetical protein MSJ26_07425 [Oscillospiraceae bacterium]|nr:hypothetical protein [Oscillospiraceae bacterium]
MTDYPVDYCCIYRLNTGETVEEIISCINRDAALKKAKYDVRNKLYCESVFFCDKDLSVTFTLDCFGERSGVLKINDKKHGVFYNNQIRNFFVIPLGQIDRGNIEVNLKCYWELSRLWSSDKNIIKSFLKYAESDYNNIADFMYDHCKFRKEWMDILRKYYGDFANMLDEEIREWCTDYFGGYYRIDFAS